jgi:hypothetical protein
MRPLPGLPALLLIVVVTFFLIFAPGAPAHAASNAAELIDEINQANTNGSGTITLTASIILETVEVTADGPNGLPVITGDITINGGGHTISRSVTAPEFRILLVADTGTLRLNNVTISGGRIASDNGGGIRNNGGTVIITNSVIMNHVNTGFSGGAISNANNGQLIITGSVITNNTTASLGGGIDNLLSSTVTITNSTFSGNHAGNNGGGIWNGGMVTITNSTFSGNHADDMGGAIRNGASGNAIIRNTIMAGNTDDNCSNISIGTFNAVNSLADDATCDGFTQVSAAALDLGTFTGQVFPLGASSVAIGAGDPSHCPATDQLSQPRKSPCDIGAYETQFITGDDGTVIVAPPPSGPAPPMCNLIDSTDISAHGLPDGFYCRVLMRDGAWQTHAGTVPQELINNGVILAVDVFELSGQQVNNHFGGHVPICLSGAGRLIFLDATTSPRAMIELETFSEGGMTCGWVPNAGTLVLISGN